MNDQDLLALVADERRRSVGFDHDATLQAERQQALNYYKGDMPDVPAMQGRSKAVSTDVAEAIDTVLPDLMEIFTGEEVVAFLPKGEEDEEAAEQETDYINHVFFNENAGFLILHTLIKDSLLTKTGVATWWAEEYDDTETLSGKTEEEAAAALQQYPDAEIETGDDGLYVLTISRKGKKPCVAAVPSEDFTVSRDTVRLTDTPYCAMRSRPRAYELISRGIDADKVLALPAYGRLDGETGLARDTAGEGDEADTGGIGEHRLVEVHNHFVKVQGGYERVMTDANETTILERETVNAPRFAAITPYLVPHRFYGESVADKLLEIQRIKTALTRMALDSGYFALNQRMAVDMDKATDWTITDLLRNEPNVPVRVRGQGAVTPLTSGGLSFDAFGALEYFSVQGEQRTGIVRNAQGLNPDTLHDTAKGAMALMTAAQKRVRMIARVFAETGLKDMFLGLHALIRETASGPLKARLRNRWVEIDPTTWGNRSDMTIEIGVGAAGKEAQAVMLQQGLAVMQEVITMQGGVSGPFVTPDNAYNFLKRYLEKGLDFKSADPYLSDPAEAEPQEPKPDPAMLEVQAKMQLAQQEAEAKQQLAQQQAMADVQLAQARAQAEIETSRAIAQEKSALARAEAEERALLKRQENEEAMQARREMAAFELQHKRDVAEVELQQRAREIEIEADLKLAAIRMNAETESQKIAAGSQVGGEPG